MEPNLKSVGRVGVLFVLLRGSDHHADRTDTAAAADVRAVHGSRAAAGSDRRHHQQHRGGGAVSIHRRDRESAPGQRAVGAVHRLRFGWRHRSGHAGGRARLHLCWQLHAWADRWIFEAGIWRRSLPGVWHFRPTGAFGSQPRPDHHFFGHVGQPFLQPVFQRGAALPWQTRPQTLEARSWLTGLRPPPALSPCICTAAVRAPSTSIVALTLTRFEVGAESFGHSSP